MVIGKRLSLPKAFGVILTPGGPCRRLYSLASTNLATLLMSAEDKPEILISRALSPANPVDLYIDEDRPYVVAVFEDEELPIAIGRNGQNIRLASEVTGYTIDAVKKTDYEGEKTEKRFICVLSLSFRI